MSELVKKLRLAKDESYQRKVEEKKMKKLTRQTNIKLTLEQIK